MDKRYAMMLLIVALAIGISTAALYAHQKGLVGKKPIAQGNVVLLEEKVSSEGAPELQVQRYAKDLEVPWDIVFTSHDRALVSERPGRIRELIKGNAKKDPLITFPEVATSGEAGLMGLALDPNYDTTKRLYACIAYKDDDSLQTKVIQLQDLGGSIREEKTIIDNIPAAQYHDGCRIAFGPDKKLYITTGDATNRDLAQDKTSVAGKILRLNTDGSIPEDNPFPESPIYSLGHRNPQGLAWHPETKVLYATEHGPSGFDGAPGGDEVNRILPGQNYGWPTVSHTKHDARYVDPLLVFTPAEAPGSALFYRGDAIPSFRNTFFFGALKGEGLMRVVFNSSGDKALSYGKLALGDIGRIRTVIEGPNGALYITTSNRDGRGKPRPGDDSIYRITTSSE
jgi:aldose sugar dehydrogenase